APIRTFDPHRRRQRLDQRQTSAAFLAAAVPPLPEVADDDLDRAVLPARLDIDRAGARAVRVTDGVRARLGAGEHDVVLVLGLDPDASEPAAERASHPSELGGLCGHPEAE